MNSVKIRSQVGEDGLLRLELPVGAANVEVELVVVFQVLEHTGETNENGWPAGFFAATAGSVPDFPLDADEGFVVDEQEHVVVSAASDA